jgi:hypothetical protein
MKYKTGHFTCYEKRTFALANNSCNQGDRERTTAYLETLA